MSQPRANQGPRTSTPVDPPRPFLDFKPILDPEVTPRACQVLWALCYWAWGLKWYCWPTNRQIADLVGCSPRTVAYALKLLKARGYLTTDMIPTTTGWFRTIHITDRVPQPKLAIIDPPAEPSDEPKLAIIDPPAEPSDEPGPDPEPDPKSMPHQALGQEGGGRATDCATPLQPVARPVVQPVAFEGFLESEKEKKLNGEPTTSPKEGGSSAPQPTEEGPRPEDISDFATSWAASIDIRTTADLAHWAGVARKFGPDQPMGKVARKVLARCEGRPLIDVTPTEAGRRGYRRGGEKPGPGSPTKDPQGPASRDKDSVRAHSSGPGGPGQLE